MPTCRRFTAARIGYWAKCGWRAAACLVILSDYEDPDLLLHIFSRPGRRPAARRDERLPAGQVMRRRGRQEAGVRRQASEVVPADEALRAERLRRDDGKLEVLSVRQERQRDGRETHCRLEEDG